MITEKNLISKGFKLSDLEYELKIKDTSIECTFVGDFIYILVDLELQNVIFSYYNDNNKLLKDECYMFLLKIDSDKKLNKLLKLIN